MPHYSANQSPRESFIRCLVGCQVILVPVLILSLYIKFSVARAAKDVLQATGLQNNVEFLSLIRGDLLAGLLVLPLIAAAITYYWPAMLRWNVLCCATLAALFLMDCELRAFNLLGNFASFGLMYEGLRWALQNSGLAGDYITLKSLIRLVVVLASVFALRQIVKGRALDLALAIRPVRYSLFLLQGAILLVPWVPKAQATAYHQTVFAQLKFALSGEVEGPLVPLMTLRNEYQALTGAPIEDPASPYFGRAGNANIILFVMETVPDRCAFFSSDLSWAPTLARLRSQAWVGTRHYSTYPFTPRAFYSIINSEYPPELVGGPFDFSQAQRKGMFQILKARGYQTGVYGVGFDRFEDLFTTQEVDKVRTSACYVGSDTGSDYDKKWLARQIPSDQQCQRLMLDDLSDSIEKKRHFAVLFAPQVSHGPWQDVVEQGPRDPLDRCRDLVALQDQWLGKVVAFLESKNELKNTIIVVTADHGVRFVTEDPRFRPGMIDDYTFHVPLLVYAPMALQETQPIPWMTSHIDIQPSLLDLLGVQTGRELEQGTAIWDEKLRQRTTYFWAGRVMGSDGFYRAGKYYMWDRVRGSIFAGDRLEFSERDRVAETSSVSRDVKSEIEKMDLIRRSWLRCAQKGCPGESPVDAGMAIATK
jgi:hypothetical protein